MMKAYEKEVADQGGVPFVVREVKDSNEMAEDVSQAKFGRSVDAVEDVGMEADGLKSPLAAKSSLFAISKSILAKFNLGFI